MKDLKTLEEHNIKELENTKLTFKLGNKISCPKCCGELVDSSDEVLCSMPPQYRVHCPFFDCDFTGTRY